MGNQQLLVNHTQICQSVRKLSRTIQITYDELSLLIRISKERSRLRHWSLCTIDRVYSNKPPNGFCQQTVTVVLQYEPIDYILSSIKHQFPLPTNDVENIIFSVCQCLLLLQEHNRYHGDINTHSICIFKNRWKLIDNCFINKGVTSYEKVLEGEVGFISPKQMQDIRYGFLKQSPAINGADQVFALGMTCLQIMSGKPSKLCYKQSFHQFNERHINKLVSQIQTRYSNELCRLVVQMIMLNQNQRISIKQIISQPCISRHYKRIFARK